MTERKSAANEDEISRDRLTELLNEDLSREYQAIIASWSIPKCSAAPNTWASLPSSKSTPNKSSITP